MIDNLNNKYVTRWVTIQERFPNKSMLMIGTNNKLRFRNTKLYLIMRQIQNMKKLYSDKKGVSCVKVRVMNLIRPQDELKRTETN